MPEENKNIKENPEEIKRLREIVLESIGEKKKEAQQEGKAVDEKISNFLIKSAAKIKKSAPEALSIAKEIKKETKNKVLESLGEKQEEEKPKKKIEPSRALEFKIKENKKKELKVRESNAKFEKLKKIIPPIAPLPKSQSSSVVIHKNKEQGKILIRRAIKFSLAFILLCFISLNLLLSFITYTFQPKNRIFMELAEYFITPAILSNAGWISYTDYQNYLLKNYGVNASLNNKEIQIDLIEKMAIIKTAKEYGIKIYGINNINFETMARVNKAVLLSSLNKGPLEKITKARESVVAGESFQEATKKYGDEYNYGFITKEGAQEKFGPAVNHLSINEVSNIILTSNGYYLIQMTEKREGTYGLKYIFVKANKTLENLVEERMGRIRLWSLVD